jgi:hypothetical protein
MSDYADSRGKGNVAYKVACTIIHPATLWYAVMPFFICN